MRSQKTYSPDHLPLLGRRDFLTASAAMAAATLGTASRASAEAAVAPLKAKPNIVMIIIDTLRADALGCYGSNVGASPELDAIAKKSVQFNFVTSCASWTLPAIGSLTTGRYPRSVGLFQSTDYLQDVTPSIGQQLKAAGYKTYGITANAMINSVAGFNRGFDRYQDVEINWEAKGMRTVPSDKIFGDAKKLIQDKGDAPAYLQINIMETHEYFRGDGKLTRPEFDNLFPKVTADASRREYFQALRQASIETGAFIDGLRKTPGWENTVFIILGDHGEGLNDHPRVWMSNGHGNLLYRSMVSVPMLWYYPGGNFVPSAINTPVSLLDVAPAILELTGAPAVAAHDGVSLAPFLAGKSLPASRPAFITETYGTGIEKIGCHSSTWSYLHNRDLHAGCREYELQKIGAFTDGKHTDVADLHPDAAFRLAKFIDEWQEAHPKLPPVKVSEVSDPGDRKKELEALGYI